MNKSVPDLLRINERNPTLLDRVVLFFFFFKALPFQKRVITEPMFFQVWFSSSKGTANGCKQGIYYSFRDTFSAPEKDSLLHVSRTFSFLLYPHGDNNGQEGGKKDRRRSAFQPQLRQFNNLRIIWSSMGKLFVHLDYFFKQFWRNLICYISNYCKSNQISVS